MYLVEPISSHFTESEAKLVLGGQASGWSEFIDEDVMDAYYWPRTAAIAERLWSNVSVRNITTAQKRLQSFACFLKRKGIKSGPLGPSAPCII